MRNTAANKLRRIELDLVRCLNALERLEASPLGDTEEPWQRDQQRKRLEAHIAQLEERKRFWQKGGDR